MALSTKRKAKKSKKQAATTADAFGTASQKAEQAVEELQKLAATLGPVVTEGAREAKVKAAEAQQRLMDQGEKLSQDLGPRAEKLRHDVQDDYLPRARKTATTTGNVLKAAAEAARKEIEKGQGDIKTAVLQPTPQKKKGRAGKVLLILGLAAAGAAAGYVVWQKTRPVEDPWAPPADFARAHYPAASATETDSSTVQDTVGSADAGDVASSLNTADRSSDTTPKDVKVESDQDISIDDDKKGTHRGDA
ncbi:hypothetical protein [Brachybacterium sp. UMB0905]|uniref:hypothetical protein n=1 Tax=Brachybacterium sp. UMB0905 TaxID=2069310 RepID=UPI000C805E05|nr:hypothetical protein [Brachybacterium sp. UMB0905]PMC74478.1 hypothetical protein CJ197_13285 [Brachybacterium sp. UMB0905]